VTDLALYSLDEDNVVRFGFGNMNRLVSGPEEALQVVAYHLFLGDGSNSYDRDDGADLQSLIRGSVKSSSEIRVDAAIIINKAQNRILLTQSDDKPANATVTNLQLVDARAKDDRVMVTVRIDLLDGNSFQATFATS